MAATGGAGTSAGAATTADVVCSLQGAFAPPHKGHAGSALRAAIKLLELYPSATSYTILFMPTSQVASKDSLSYKSAVGVADGDTTVSPFVSEGERKVMLDMYCNLLNSIFRGEDTDIASLLDIAHAGGIKAPDGKTVTFETSPIEYELGPVVKGTATIHTLRKLKELYPMATRVLAMGEDNGRQLPWWGNITEYPELISALLFIDREPQEAGGNLSPIRYASTYRADREYMQFASGVSWKPDLPLTTVMTGSDSSIRDVLVRFGAMTHLLPPPAPYSSTAVRIALASGKHDDVTQMCGKDVANFLVEKRIGIRTKDDVKKMLTTQGGGRRRRLRSSRRRKGLKAQRRSRRRRV